MANEVFGRLLPILCSGSLRSFPGAEIQQTEADKKKRILEFKVAFEKVKTSRSDAFFASPLGAVFATLGVTVAVAGFYMVSGSVSGAASGMTAYVMNRVIDNPYVAGAAGTMTGVAVSRIMNVAANAVLDRVLPGNHVAMDF